MERITGVPKEKIKVHVARYCKCSYGIPWFRRNRAIARYVYSNAIGRSAMITGNIGKKGAGVNPLRGQNNVQGAADMVLNLIKEPDTWM